MTWSEVSLGVPCSPNRHLDKLGVFRKFDIARGEVELHGFLNVRPGFRFGFASGGAPRQLGTNPREIPGLGIWLQRNSDLHSSRTVPRQQVCRALAPRLQPLRGDAV